MNDIYANWADVYDYFYPNRSDEVDFWARQAAPYGRQVIDLMCGTAEVSLGLARRGCRVLGVDLSPAMLSVAAKRLEAAADYPARSLLLARGDISSIPAPTAAHDFALVGGNGSFNHLGSDQVLATLREIRRVLRPGGALGMELVNPHLLQEIETERSFGPLRPPPPGVRVVKATCNHYNHQTRLFHIHQVTHCEIDGVCSEFGEAFALHVLHPDSAQRLLEAAGFCDVCFYGDYGLKAFDRWSADLLVVATAVQ